MKEFACRHPFITFFICDALISGIVHIVDTLKGVPPKDPFQIEVTPEKGTDENKEEEKNDVAE